MSDFSFDLADLTIPHTQLGIPQLYSTKLNVEGWLMIFNETPYYVVVTLGSGRKLNLLADQADIVQVYVGDAILYITASQYLSVQNPPSITIKFKYFRNKPEGVFPVALTRQAVVADPSGSIGYSAFVMVTNGESALAACGLNIFNPSNSNVKFRLFTAVVSQSKFAIVQGNAFIRTDGTNNLFGGGVQIFNHNIGGANSVASCTFFTNLAVAAPNLLVGSWQLYTEKFDYLNPSGGVPSAVQLYPGQNFLLSIKNPASRSLCFFYFNWSEQ